ncbi:MAG TPA: hypothetical protein DIT58_04420 [Porticoccaceae bacterium]|nr:hypothetical protein [Porticoccaceae bacterium]
MLTNLIGNAIKFTERGEVAVATNLVEELDDRLRLKIEVKDTGIGITQDKLKTIFEAFNQADGTTSRRFGGTGLGLSISSQLVRLMGGELSVNSSVGVGSTFSFVIELEKQEAHEVDLNSEVNDFTGRTVLVVDDDAASREVLVQYLRNWKAKAVEASSGLEALRLLRESGQSFDVLLLDLIMPGMDGVELARAVRADQGLRDVAIVLLGSESLTAQKERMRVGFAGVLAKPINRKDLQICLRSVFENHSKITPVVGKGATSTEGGRVRAFSGKVLVAEDNPINQEVAKTMLEKMGLEVDVAANGREAANALFGGDYHLVLMDIHMPDIDGIESTFMIREWEQDKDRHIPIVALTANAMTGDRERFLESGMDDYLSKPFSQDDLAGLLARWVPVAVSSETGAADGETANDVSPSEACTLKDRLDDDDETDILDLDAFAQLENLYSEEPDKLAHIVELFIQVAQNLQNDLHKFITEGNAEKIRETAHSLKSSCGNVAALRLAKSCAVLERAGGSGDLELSRDQLEIVRIEYAKASEALRTAVG